MQSVGWAIHVLPSRYLRRLMKRKHPFKQKLNEINEERKAIVEQITQEALAMVNKENHIHLLVNRGWHEGVLGIVAGKIMNETGKPTLVLTLKEDGSAKGSGRSIEALNLLKCLTRCEIYLLTSEDIMQQSV